MAGLSHWADHRSTGSACCPRRQGDWIAREAGREESACGGDAEIGRDGRHADAEECHPTVLGRDIRLQPVDRQPPLGPDPACDRESASPVRAGPGRGDRPLRNSLADGAICPTWDWKAVPDLYSGKAKYAGINVQIACNLNGDVAAIGQVPVHGARHDAYAFEASGLKDSLDKSLCADDPVADLGYIGVDGIGIVPFKRKTGQDLLDWQKEFNGDLSKLRAAVERAVAKVKTWAHAQRGRRTLPVPHRKVREHAGRRDWIVLLQPTQIRAMN